MLHLAFVESLLSRYLNAHAFTELHLDSIFKYGDDNTLPLEVNIVLFLISGTAVTLLLTAYMQHIMYTYLVLCEYSKFQVESNSYFSV